MIDGKTVRPVPGALEVAIAAARRGGEVIRQDLGTRPLASVKSSPSDLVTVVDRASERAIRQAIGEAFPDHAVLGEEEGGTATEAEYLWVVDPLDGTNNFVQTLPFYAVSIALAHRGQLVAGVIYDPVRDELFAAEVGMGATLNGHPIAVDPAAKLADAIVSTRTPYDHGRALVDNLEAYGACAARCRNMRNLGAAALEMAWVACGRLTAYWEMQLNAWDRAAGALLIAEAGGLVTGPDGRPAPLLPRCGVVASNGRIHQELVNLIRPGS